MCFWNTLSAAGISQNSMVWCSCLSHADKDFTASRFSKISSFGGTVFLGMSLRGVASDASLYRHGKSRAYSNFWGPRWSRVHCINA